MDNFARESHKPIKIVLHRIGYWSFWPEWQMFPHPSEVCNHPWDPDELKIVIEYLKHGTMVSFYGSNADNRMDHTDEAPELGSAEFTDGYWFWPEGLAYYLEKYKVALPPEFIKDALKPKKKYKFSERWHFTSDRKWLLWSLKYRKHAGSRWMVRLRYIIIMLLPLVIFIFLLVFVFNYFFPKIKIPASVQLERMRVSGRTIKVNEAIDAVNQNRGFIYSNAYENGLKWWFSAEKKLVNYQNHKRFFEINCLAIDFSESYDREMFNKLAADSIIISDGLV
jgi:hypothetical protein